MIASIYYSVKPSLVTRKLRIKLPDPKKEEIQILSSNEYFDIVYDPDKGIAFNILLEHLDRGLVEVESTLKEAKLHFIYEEESLLSFTPWAFMSGLDQQVLESHRVVDSEKNSK